MLCSIHCTCTQHFVYHVVLMYIYTITVLDSHLALSVVEERSSPATWLIVKDRQSLVNQRGVGWRWSSACRGIGYGMNNNTIHSSLLISYLT